MVFKNLWKFLFVVLLMAIMTQQGSSPCPVQSTTGSIFSGHITIGIQNSLIRLDLQSTVQCYNYSLPYQFTNPPSVAIGIDEFRSKNNDNLFFSVKPIVQDNRLFVPFIVRTYYGQTRWTKISFYFIVEDRFDIEAGYYQIDTGRLGGCQLGKSINVFLPFKELLISPHKKHSLFLSGFEISTQQFNVRSRSPFEIAIPESLANATGLIVTLQVTTITKVHAIFLNYVVYAHTKLSIVAGAFVYHSQASKKISFSPEEAVGRNFARIHGISGFVIKNSYQQIIFDAQWTGNRFQFTFQNSQIYLQYLSYSYLFIIGSECQNCLGYPITYNGSCLKDCPAGTFLTSEKICISCGVGMYWNGTGCIKSCPEGQYLNFTTNSCQCPVGRYWTGKICITCLQGRIFNYQTKSCQCPLGKIWNGYACIEKVQCLQGKVWSIFTYSCECPTGTFWNGTFCKRVIPCPDGKIANDAGQCICPEYKVWNGKFCETVECRGGQFWNGSTCVCEPGLNFNGTFCIRCINGQYWNSLTKNCECQQGSTWNGNFCEKVQFCSGQRIWSAIYKQCICEQGKFWNGAKCVIKPKCCCGQKWNENTQQCDCYKGFNWDGQICVQCMNGKNWNQLTRQCECIQGTKWNGNFCVVVQNCYGGMMWNQNTWSCQCPSITVWKDNYCIANPCVNGQVWDQVLKYCVCPPGKVYLNNTCLPQQLQCTGGRYWDPQTYSCKCPNNQWFDGTLCKQKAICVSNQIYNYRNNQCQCPQGLIWLASKKTCGDTTCPAGKIWDGYGCAQISCPPNSYYNGTECVCNTYPRDKCQPWEYFDGVQCVYFKNQCPPGMIWNNTKCISLGNSCPSGSYQTDKGCKPIPQLCPDPCIYDIYTSSCKCQSNSCPPGTYSSSSGCIPYEKCPDQQIFSPKYLQCVCPDQNRFNFNGKKCLTCPSNKIWTNTKGGKECQCPLGTFEVGNRCEAIQNHNRCKNIPNSVWSSGENRCKCKDNFSVVGIQCICEGIVLDGECNRCAHKPHSQWKYGICQCILGYFQENNKCIAKNSWVGNDSQSNCNVGTYFDSQQKKCLSCPDGCLSCTDCYTCSQCRQEFYLDKQSKLCVEHCGDGKKFILECDDGNNNNGDGCSCDCKIQEGFICRGGSPNNPDNCLIYQPNYVTITQTGQIRYSEAILLNLKLDYLPKELLQGSMCQDRCNNVLMGEIVSGDKAISIKTSYIPKTTYSFSMQISFGRPYIGEFELKIFVNPSLGPNYFKRVKIDKDLRIKVNPAYLSKTDSDLEDQLF